MKNRLRHIFWRILGIDYKQTLSIHDYVFLKDDKFSVSGKQTYDNGAIVFRWSEAPLKIGKFCSIANGVRFIVDEGYHGSSKITSYPLLNNLYKNEIKSNTDQDKVDFLKNINQKEGISIGNDVWLGLGCYIMPGVKIGNGATIAANAVVTKDIPDYSVAAGVPAVVIKQKFDNDTISKLNEIAWWDWDLETIKNRIEDFYDSPINFVKKHYIK
ncbi:CatB-related O-acetyltransferase [Mariniflexile sp.]|uniref:CatB-related O-acetyltransferase n=1 Tax=Mariniflexile sp. TaxID=1979402 RepID=UPI00356B3B0F